MGKIKSKVKSQKIGNRKEEREQGGKYLSSASSPQSPVPSPQSPVPDH
ncbi:hypothetical protein [Sphaerospermopsis reniformis]|nr:hypothetical protein [Sphaerospermopsis reniformis]